jgi:Zn-dependent peptidase ImmA (M78 family)/DNA-binding XRE family transcriptional regulator
MTILDRIRPEELGGRLKIARTSARITQEQAAGAIGVGRTTIVAIECGERQVKAAELPKLAELYGVSVNSLLRESAVHFDLIPQFRRSVSAREDEESSLDAARLLQRLVAWCVELEGLLGRRLRKVSVPEQRIIRASWADQAEDLALDLRQRLGVGAGPIADIFVLAEMDMGIRLFLQNLPSKIAGVFAYQEDVGACILINVAHPQERRAWTCAHEIAHFLTTRQAVDVDWVGRGERSIVERFADRFAAAFLMPASSVRLKFHEIYEEGGKFSARNIVFLARAFNVSVEALARRLEQLNLIPNGTFESLLDRGFSPRAVSEAFFDGDTHGRGASPPWLTMLVLDALEREFLTESQAAEILGVNIMAVRGLVDSLHMDDGAV